MRAAHLQGIYVAVVTPMTPDGLPKPEDLEPLFAFLIRRGAHGVLLLGTTGEGPSHSLEERLALMRAAAAVREGLPGFRVLVGTGTPSLEETLALTKAAFDLGLDAVVVLPPYYFRTATEEGLFSWFAEVLRRAVPRDAALLGYHIPQVSGVPLSLRLVTRLAETFPNFVGLKDSSGDPAYVQALGERFRGELLVLTGNDRLLNHTLRHHGGGAITALANIASPILREAWETFQRTGQPDEVAQIRLNQGRDVLERFPPYGPTLKAVLHHGYGFPAWGVKPPLLPLPREQAEAVTAAFRAAFGEFA